MSDVTQAAVKTFPVVETFGPVVQGEGYLAGMPTHFVRFGLCDFRCAWCDSMFAVEPAQVKEHASQLSADQIAEACHMLDDGVGNTRWVTLSGGNPAIHELGDVVEQLHSFGYSVTVETQGSIWRDWLGSVDHLTISPKPPSSGMVNDAHTEKFAEFMRRADLSFVERSIKIVVFDDEDLAWARDVVRDALGLPTFLSVGTDPVGKWGTEVVAATSHAYTIKGVADRYAWLCEKVAGDPAFMDTRVLPQLHVVAYGHLRGK